MSHLQVMDNTVERLHRLPAGQQQVWMGQQRVWMGQQRVWMAIVELKMPRHMPAPDEVACRSYIGLGASSFCHIPGLPCSHSSSYLPSRFERTSHFTQVFRAKFSAITAPEIKAAMVCGGKTGEAPSRRQASLACCPQ